MWDITLVERPPVIRWRTFALASAFLPLTKRRATYGDGTRDRALVCARTLGVAMQITNILHDVGEDASTGRCYLRRSVMTTY